MMSNFKHEPGNGMNGGWPPVTGLGLARAFATAWMTAIVAVIILPAMFVFGAGAGIVRRLTPRKRGGPVIVEGTYRVLNLDTGNE